MSQDGSFVPEPWCTTDEPELDWLYNTGSIEQALAYSKLFWPSFIEHEDCVFLTFDDDKYRSWMAELHDDKARVEAMMNHRHIADVFEGAESAPHELLIGLGRILKQCWKAKLLLDFPQRRFEVQFDDRQSAAPSDYEITFYQPR